VTLFLHASSVFVAMAGTYSLCKRMRELYNLAVVTNDIYTKEDQQFLIRSQVPRKGGPGIMKSDLLIINKIDLAPHVGASLEVMDCDARKMRGERPFVFTNLKTGEGL